MAASSKPNGAIWFLIKPRFPGSDAEFEMVPIPGGKFMMGSPAGEKGHKADEGAAVRGTRRSILDGQVSGHLVRIQRIHESGG